MTKTNSLLLAGVLSATLMTSVNVRAEEAAAAPASPHTLTTNVGLFTDYVFRGISYGKERGAVQGGVDYSHSSGIYLGVWATSVNSQSLYDNTTEIDLYGGYVHQFNPDLSLNVGVLQFYYPNSRHPDGVGNINTTELNAALTYKYFTLKHSYAVSDFFGAPNSDGSQYTEFNVAYTLPFQQITGLNVALHVGHQKVENVANADYTDYLVGVNKDFTAFGTTGWNAGVNYTTTDANDSVYFYGADNFKSGDSRATAYIKRTF